MWMSKFFGNRYIFPMAAVVAVLVALPTLGFGFYLDDYQQRIVLLTGSRENLFNFFPHANGWIEAQLQSGVFPWWFVRDNKIAFYRPVAEWLMRLDYRFWPNNVPLMHLHSIVWYGLLTLVAGFTYRALIPSRWIAGLAAVLFAVDAAHGGAVAWLPNRNSLICLASALLTLLCYRRVEWRWQILGYFLFAFSLSSSEAALAITGYLFAYEVFLSDQAWRKRIVRLLPYALISIGWIIFWKIGGYGTGGAGWGKWPAYVDPISSPAQFLSTFIYRFPAYLVGQFFLPAVDIFTGLEDTPLRFAALAYAISIMAVLGWFMLPLLRGSAVARFFALGMLIAVIPICGSPAFTRSLWFVGFGASGLLAVFIAQYRELPLGRSQLRWSGAFAALMLVMHLWLSPVLFVGYGKLVAVLDGAMDSYTLGLPDQTGSPKKILALSAYSYATNITYVLMKDQALSLGTAPTRTPPSIVHIRALSEGDGAFDLIRPDADTLIVKSDEGLDNMRPARYGFKAGERVVLDDVDIVVRTVSEKGAPTEIEYRFKAGVLNDYEVLAWGGDKFLPATLPPVGGSMRVETKLNLKTEKKEKNTRMDSDEKFSSR